MAKVDPDVTIVSANYNNGNYLQEYFDSILNSSVLPAQCIICDDASTDHSKEVIEKYADQYDWIKPIYLPKNQGVANATNAAIEKVETKYILRVDPDDKVSTMRLEKQVGYLRKYSAVDVLGGNCTYFDSATKKTLHSSKFPSGSQEILKLFQIGENGVLNGTVMAKSSVFKKFQYRQEMVWAEDYDIFARMIHSGIKFAGQMEPLTMVRIHRSSATSNISLDTLQKAHKLSQSLFDNQIGEKAVLRNYRHLLHYRRYMLGVNPIKRLMNLALSVYYRPDKLMKRIFKR